MAPTKKQLLEAADNCRHNAMIELGVRAYALAAQSLRDARTFEKAAAKLK